MRGILNSIITRSKGKKNERSAGSSEEESEDLGPKDVSMMESESPTKKSRVMMEKEEDSKPKSAATAT